jgi:cell division inhibitor SepF
VESPGRCVRAELAEACRSRRDAIHLTVTSLGVTKTQPRETVAPPSPRVWATSAKTICKKRAEKYVDLPPVHAALHRARPDEQGEGHRRTVRRRAVDRPARGRLAIAKAARALGRTVRVLVQVNVSPNGALRRCIPADARRTRRAAAQGRLEVDGVMAIGPLEGDVDGAFALAREAFGRSADRRSRSECRPTGSARSLRVDDDSHRYRDIRARGRRKKGSRHERTMFSGEDRLVVRHRSRRAKDDESDYDDRSSGAQTQRRPLFPEAGRRRVGPSVSRLRAARLLRRDRNRRCPALAARVAIVNLQGADRTLLQRVVDFTSGVAYTIEGRIQKLAEAIYLVVPAGVAVNSPICANR